MKKLFPILLFLMVSFHLKAQVSVAYHYSFALSSIAVGTNPDRNIWGEFRIGMDTELNDFSPEVVGFWNYLKRDDFKLFVGLGLRLNLAAGPILPAFGFTFNPIESKPNFAIHAEGAVLARAEDTAILRGSLGLRYFIRKKN